MSDIHKNAQSSLPNEAAVRERIDHIFISNLTDNGLANEATDEIIDLIKSAHAATAAEAYARGYDDCLKEHGTVFKGQKIQDTEAYRRGQTNGVAWSVKVLDDLHMADSSISSDMIYKGAKNTIRDRYKAETGTDPAPKYPVKARVQKEET